MKRTGNVEANKIYNPRNIKPAIPIDADEADSAMERFIRQKYESKILEDGKPKPPSRQDPSYISKPVEDVPPPLPPKPVKKLFGLRTSFGSSKSSSSGLSIGHQANKQSRTFGLSLNDGNGSFDSKLTILRNMGFPDDKRNAAILKGLNDDLDKTVETLVRLGEGAPMYNAHSPVSRRTTPGKFSDSTGSKPVASTNPFDQLDSAPPHPAVGISINRPSSQTTPNSDVGPGKSSYNPFDVPTSQPAATPGQSFQNLQVSQPLFPNTTGGYPSQLEQIQAARYQHSMTPPVTMALNSGLVTSPAPMNGTYNPFFQSTPTTATNPSQTNVPSSNPFFAQMPQQNTAFQRQMTDPQQPVSNTTNNPYYPQHSNTMPSYSSTSPFFQQQQQQQQQQQFESQQQQQYQQYQQQFEPQQQQFQHQPQQQLYQQSTGNPYFSAMAPAGQAYPSQRGGLQPQQTFQTNQPSTMDKSSILALYNFSQPPPTIPEQPQQQPEQPQPQAPPPLNRTQSYPQPSQPFPPQNDPSNPPIPSSTPFDTLTQSGNPFGVPSNSAGIVQPAPNPGAAPLMRSNSNNPYPRTHMSQESIDVGRAQSGRHSPDIFASLSARYA